MKISAKHLIVPGVILGAGLVQAQDPVLDPGTGSGETIGSHGDPFTPVGNLKVTPTVVQPGVQPNMFWDIEYPKSVEDLTVIVEPGKLVTTNDQTETLEVRVAGVSYDSEEGVDLPVAMWVRVDGGSWDLVFYGRTDEVDPGDVVFRQNVPAGTNVDFAFRGRTSSGSWYATQWTLADTPNIEAVVSGDPVPADSSAFSNGNVESFVTQFVNDSDTIVAGPRDIIYFCEVASTTPGDSSFDMQDIVAVASFKDNRGHGNNADGYDGDNTGVGTSGVGGVEHDTVVDDELGGGQYLDDEGKKIKRKDSVIASE